MSRFKKGENKLIVWHEKINKSNDIIKAVINQLLKDQINIDGVVENFNNGKEQGTVLKLFDKYNPHIDSCIWVYLPSDRNVNNHMEVIVGKHINCNQMNMWEGENLTSISFEDNKAIEMHKKTRDYILEVITENIEKTHDIQRI